MDIPDGNFHQESPRCSVLMEQCAWGFLMDIPDGNLHQQSPHCSVLMEQCAWGFLMDIPDGNLYRESPHCSVLMEHCGGFLMGTSIRNAHVAPSWWSSVGDSWRRFPVACSVSEMTYTVSSGTLNPSIPYIPFPDAVNCCGRCEAGSAQRLQSDGCSRVSRPTRCWHAAASYARRRRWNWRVHAQRLHEGRPAFTLQLSCQRASYITVSACWIFTSSLGTGVPPPWWRPFP